jgi:hypothetical protein
MSNEEKIKTQTVKIDFSQAKDRADLLTHICENMKLAVAEVKTRFKVNGPTVGYEALTNVLRGLKVSYSCDFETNDLIAQVPLVPAVGIKAIMNPELIQENKADLAPIVADANSETVQNKGTELSDDPF